MKRWFDITLAALLLALSLIPMVLIGVLIRLGSQGPALFNEEDLIELRTRKGIHRLVPGVIGWAQINGGDEIPIPVTVEFDSH